MKYALVNGQRQEAKPGLLGNCEGCGSPMIARCGEYNIWHWAHRVGSNCDHWWEPETTWHRAWKAMFPEDWQEVVYIAENGEKHRADVKTDQGWVLEFQHSNIHPNERKSREAFYEKLIWIVNGARRKSDKSQFFKAWNGGELVDQERKMRRISLQDKCALLRDWADSRVPVFFDFSWCNEPEEAQLSLIDFSGGNKLGDAQLWCLFLVFDKMSYVVPFPQSLLIKYHTEPTKMPMDFTQLLEGLRAIAGEIARPGQHNPDKRIAEFMRDQERKFRKRLPRRGPREWEICL